MMIGDRNSCFRPPPYPLLCFSFSLFLFLFLDSFIISRRKSVHQLGKGPKRVLFFFFFLPTKKRNDVCVAYEEELCVSSVCNSIPDTQNDSQGNDFEQKARLSTLSLALVH